MAELIPREKLLFGRPIELKDFGIIYPPKIKLFLDELEYGKFKRVFSVRKELYIDEDNEDYEKLRDFDLIIYMNLMEDLISSLKVLYKTDDIKIAMADKMDVSSIRIIVNNEYYINRDNYTKFADLILITLHEGNNVAEVEVKKELTEIELKMEKRRKEFERKKALKEAQKKKEEDTITIFDLANYIIHTDGSTFDYEKVLNLTVYQLINTFNLYRQKEGYSTFMDYKTSGNFQIEENMEHWFFGK